MRYQLFLFNNLEAKRRCYMFKDLKKTTGSYYTCLSVADYIVNWAIDDKNTTVLEPSFGDGSFLYSAINRFKKLNNYNPNIYGVELQEEPFNDIVMNNKKVKCYLGDFLDFNINANIDAIVGNPPYISLKNLDESGRKKAICLMKEYGVEMPSSGSLWMPFIVHATELLSKNGKLGLVLPYEITYVRYAFDLWKYLKHNYKKISIYRIYKDFFPEVDVETIIFLAEGRGGHTDKIDYKAFENIDKLFSNEFIFQREIPIYEILSMSKPFEKALLSSESKEIIENLRNNGFLNCLVEDCKFKIGYVCGNKKFFHPTAEVANNYELSKSNLLPCLVNSKDINGNKKIGLNTDMSKPKNYLFYPKTLSKGDIAYISYGEANNIHLGYKCKARSPWYITPTVEIPDVILTVFGDIPKLIANDGRYVVSNSLLGGTIKDKRKTTSKELICRWYNSLTLLMIELYIHSLGGGTLVLIPGEMDKMELLCNFPSEKIESVFSVLNESMINRGTIATYEVGDDLVLKNIYNFTDSEISSIRNSLDILRSWRRPDFRR